MNDPVRFARDMGINRRDFFRILPTAIGDSTYRADGDDIVIGPIAGHGVLTITLGAESTRRLSALMVLPRMQVDFVFSGASQTDAEQFMQRFDFYYRRGGG